VVVVIALAGLLVFGLLPVQRPIRDAWALQGDLLAVAMDWRDFGENKAVERLGWTLKHRELGESLSMDDCQFQTAPSGDRRVSCVWEVVARWPGLDWHYTLQFEAAAVLDPAGEVVAD